MKKQAVKRSSDGTGAAESCAPPEGMVAPGAAEALAFVRSQGIVLASAKGSVPRLIEAILGGPIAGNWWRHPEGSRIYNVLTEVSASKEVLVCRLLNGKITLVHRRLWPALARAAGRFTPAQLARVREEHTSGGRHRSSETAYPQWLPPEVAAQARLLGEAEALAALGEAIAGLPAGKAAKPPSRRA